MSPEPIKSNMVSLPSLSKQVDLTEATQIVQEHYRKICCGFLSFQVIASLNEPSLPYIAVRCKEHCLVEEKFRIHDVIVNRDGSIYSTRLVGMEGDVLPGFTGR